MHHAAVHPPLACYIPLGLFVDYIEQNEFS